MTFLRFWTTLRDAPVIETRNQRTAGAVVPCASNSEVSPPVGCGKALEDWSNLQADENEGQDVQCEHDCLPHCIRGYAHRCGSPLGR
jgi:hypothetical protein